MHKKFIDIEQFKEQKKNELLELELNNQKSAFTN